jgi:hypothetical protein
MNDKEINYLIVIICIIVMILLIFTGILLNIIKVSWIVIIKVIILS